MVQSTPERVVLGERYELGDLIGRGGMADVHRATDRVLQRPVAVKILRDGANDEADRARFTAEARTLAMLSHPHLVLVLDAGTASEGRPYLVMELVEGPTLADLCRTGPLEPGQVAAVGAQVASALAYAHAHGVVHRDVKPGNVLMGDSARVKLADFGIARLIGDTVRHTRTGMTMGTAAYLSPEQVSGADVTGAADVFSLGLVLLEALTGERAFGGLPTEAALARLTQSPTMPASLSPDWRELLTAMTAIAPTHRPTAEEAAIRLEAIVAGVPAVSTRPLTAPVAVETAAPVPAFADRAGAAIAQLPGRTVHGLRAMPPHQRGLWGALVALVLVLMIAAAVSDGGGSQPSQVPSDTPSEYRQPLQDLHDAVVGR